jgi:hypothetical protein
MRRELPSRSHRVLTHDDATGWTEHHRYSEQREQWTQASSSRSGIFINSTRNRVQMGPVTEDGTIEFDPPLMVARLPYKRADSWTGSWSGKTHGEYTGRTLRRTSLMVGQERVDVWVSEVVLHMSGDIEGTSVIRSWLAPSYQLVVKQYERTIASRGPAEYRCEWTGQVVSVDPAR